MTIAEIFDTMEYGPAPEASGPALEWIAGHEGRFGHFIDGEWRPPADGTYFDVLDPGTGRTLGMVAQGSEADVQLAMEAADTAFASWSRLSDHARSRHLYALARSVQRNSRLFAVLESLNNGKPIRESRDLDIPLVARHFYYHAGWAQLLHSEFADYEPLGVVGQIIPWNFPLLMLAWKIAPALAAGNTVVLKPAEFTPLTALAFAEAAQRAGIPRGVINVVTGDGRTGEIIVQHPTPAKLAFTGSTEVGRIIRRATAGSGKRLSLELGGKSPYIVFEDADLDGAIEGLVDAIWFNQGQVCCAGSRLLVQESIAEKMYGRIRSRMERLRVGNPLDKAVDIGAIVAPVQLERIQGLVERGIQEGATMWQPSWACPTDGYFYPPTLFTDVSPAATIAQVEIFGPVLVAMTFRTPAEAVELANNTPYGLAATLWSENVNVALDVARQFKAGTVWINSTNLFDAAAGFGGYRESGFGREGGKEGMFDYLRLKPAVEPRTSNHLEARSGNVRNADEGSVALDRTAKLYIGGKQVRPDSGYSLPVYDANHEYVQDVGRGNRKDIRNAVEAANAASGWASSSGHARAQVLYYVAENLESRRAEFSRRITQLCGANYDSAFEVEQTVETLFTYAAWADKFDGLVHHTLTRNVTLAMPEPIGVAGVVCPREWPLLGFVALVAPLIALGNRVVAIPSADHPLLATDMYQVLETSDLPAGVVNIVTGDRDELAGVLAAHDGVDVVWYWGEAEGQASVERESAGNMKRTWVHSADDELFLQLPHAAEEFLRESTQVKNIWVPYGA